MSLSVSGWDVAALCHPTDWCRAVRGGVCKTHPRLPHAQPKRPDCSTEDWWVYLSLIRGNFQSLSNQIYSISFSISFLLSLPRLHGGGSSPDESVFQHREQHCLLWWEICWGRSLQVFGWGFLSVLFCACTATQCWNHVCIEHSIYIRGFYQGSVVSFLAACGDLITAVFDFAHGMCALKLTEHQIALFSALVLINTGKTDSHVAFHTWNIKQWGDTLVQLVTSRIKNLFQALHSPSGNTHFILLIFFLFLVFFFLVFYI